MCRSSCLRECGPLVIERSTRPQSKVTGGRHQGPNWVTCDWNRLHCKEDTYVFIFYLPVQLYININIKLDSFLWSTRSLAVGRSQMEPNVTDILFWEHVKKYVTSWQLTVDFCDLAIVFLEFKLARAIDEEFYWLFKLGQYLARPRYGQYSRRRRPRNAQATFQGEVSRWIWNNTFLCLHCPWACWGKN